MRQGLLRAGHGLADKRCALALQGHRARFQHFAAQSRFTRGERFVYQPIPSREFDETLEQVKRWNLDQYLKEKNFEKLVYRAPATV